MHRCRDYICSKQVSDCCHHFKEGGHIVLCLGGSALSGLWKRGRRPSAASYRASLALRARRRRCCSSTACLGWRTLATTARSPSGPSPSPFGALCAARLQTTPHPPSIHWRKALDVVAQGKLEQLIGQGCASSISTYDLAVAIILTVEDVAVIPNLRGFRCRPLSLCPTIQYSCHLAICFPLF